MRPSLRPATQSHSPRQAIAGTESLFSPPCRQDKRGDLILSKCFLTEIPNRAKAGARAAVRGDSRPISIDVIQAGSEPQAATTAGIGSAVTDLIFSIAKREVTFFSGTALISFL